MGHPPLALGEVRYIVDAPIRSSASLAPRHDHAPRPANAYAPATETVYAGFWSRLWASIIDTILLSLVTYPLLISIYGWTYFSDEAVLSGPADFLLSWVLPTIGIILFWIYKSATPGKMAIHARIVDAQTGGQPSTGQMVGRYFAYFISALPLGLGILWVAFDSRKQGWHDKLAGTVVIRTRALHPELASFAAAPSNTGWSAPQDHRNPSGWR